MNENEQKTGKLSRFFEEKGFYIILFLCVIAIGIAGYVLFLQPQAAEDPALTADALTPPKTAASAPQAVLPGRNGHGAVAPTVPEPAEQTSGKPDDAVETLQPSSGALTSDKPEDKPVDKPAPVEEAPKPEPSAAPPAEKPKAEPAPQEDSAASAPDFFVKPVAGDVIRQFCISELVYDRTMGDWRTHNGADFAASTGETVMAIADGTVLSVSTGEMYGTTVVISHGGGLESSYFGLADEPTVKPGDTVKAGDVIGAVASGAHFEALEPVHLHLELKQDGKFVDPTQYLP